MSPENNKIIAKKFLLDLFGRWKFDLVDEIIHDDYELGENTVSIDYQNQIDGGKSGFIKRLKLFAKALPNLKHGIIKVLAEEDSVIVWWAMKATQADTLYHYPSKGKSVQIFGTNYFKFKDGKIIFNTINYDTFSFLIQLGHISINEDQEKLVEQYLKRIQDMRDE